MDRQKNKVSLVLGSGGARGLAHIGVIEWLTENNYDIRSIAGSSMGALIGGVYAAGKLDAYARWVSTLERMDLIRLLDISLGQAGLIKGERIIEVLRELVGKRLIEELPISFTAVATDISSEKEVWLSEGPLFDAIRASIAMPLIFTPVAYQGRQLVDGGVINPIPIAPTLNDFTDITVAVDLGGKADPTLRPSLIVEKAPSNDTNDYRNRIRVFIENLYKKDDPPETNEMGLLDVIWNSMETMQNTIARLKLAAYSPDVIVEIPRNACAFHEFHRAKELIELGKERTAKAFTKLVT